MKTIVLFAFACLTFAQAGFIGGYYLKGAQDTYIEKMDAVQASKIIK